MKKIFKLLLFFGVMACGLAACSDDDDDKLSGIIDSIDMQIDGKTVATQKFTYDKEGRLIKVTEPAIGEDGIGEVFYTFAYEENKVTVIFAEGVDDRDSDTTVFELAEGKAVSFISKNRWNTSEGELVYGDGNQIKEWIEDGRSTKFTWENGNITFIGDINFDAEVTPYENKANIDYNAIISSFPDMMCVAAYAGILGQKTKNVIFSDEIEFSVDTKDGYITEMSYKEEEEEGASYTITMKFNYK